jgi:hypothetical protein
MLSLSRPVHKLYAITAQIYITFAYYVEQQHVALIFAIKVELNVCMYYYLQ